MADGPIAVNQHRVDVDGRVWLVKAMRGREVELEAVDAHTAKAQSTTWVGLWTVLRMTEAT